MLRNRWYPILEAARLRKKPVGIKRMGQPLVLWRDTRGVARLLPTACPHRGASRAAGRVIDGQLELSLAWLPFRWPRALQADALRGLRRSHSQDDASDAIPDS